MDKPNIYEEITPIFREVFLNEELDLRPDLTADEVDGWDSNTYLQVMAAIEERFSIKFRTVEIGTVKNVGELVDLISAKL